MPCMLCFDLIWLLHRSLQSNPIQSKSCITTTPSPVKTPNGAKPTILPTLTQQNRESSVLSRRHRDIFDFHLILSAQPRRRRRRRRRRKPRRKKNVCLAFKRGDTLRCACPSRPAGRLIYLVRSHVYNSWWWMFDGRQVCCVALRGRELHHYYTWGFPCFDWYIWHGGKHEMNLE